MFYSLQVYKAFCSAEIQSLLREFKFKSAWYTETDWIPQKVKLVYMQ